MGESQRGVSKPTITPLEYLNKLCDYALSIGMSYHDYWYSEPSMLLHYTNAEQMRTIKRNNELWLQGLYVQIAISDLVPILNPFSKEHKAKPYLKKPIPITKQEQEEEEREKYQRFVDYMMSKVEKKEV